MGTKQSKSGPAKAQDDASEPLVKLIGLPGLSDYLHFVKTRVVDGDTFETGALVDEWRRANDHFRRFHISVSSWRQYVQGMRVGLGSFFMSQRRARTEHVSRLLGFGSPTSFCHAFHDAGLPSPLAVQRQLLAS